MLEIPARMPVCYENNCKRYRLPSLISNNFNDDLDLPKQDTGYCYYIMPMLFSPSHRLPSSAVNVGRNTVNE